MTGLDRLLKKRDHGLSLNLDGKKQKHITHILSDRELTFYPQDRTYGPQVLVRSLLVRRSAFYPCPKFHYTKALLKAIILTRVQGISHYKYKSLNKFLIYEDDCAKNEKN